MKRIALIISFALFLSGSIFSQAEQVPKAADNPNAPEISFDKTVHDYGTIIQGGDGTCFFKFTNTGKEPLILQKPQSSCGCTVPTWPKTPILPGESDEIKVTYNTRKMGTINKTVTVRSNAKNNTVVLRIKGKIITQPVEQLPEKETEGTPVNK